MKFYVSWSRCDPFYSVYDDNASILISINSVYKNWKLSRFPKIPKHLLIDSGGFRFALYPHERIRPKDVFTRQISILGGLEVDTIFCPLDYPILDPTISSNEKDRRITETIANAYELKNLVVKNNFSESIQIMGIIQGYDSESILHCAQEIKQIGFSIYGIGSLAKIWNQTIIKERIKSICSIINPKKIHVFGISSLPLVKFMKNKGIASFDSARPAISALNNIVIYSRPFRRFGILEPNGVPIRGPFPIERRLSNPLPCTCPVCKYGNSTILGVGKREYIRNRTVHNYYHLKRAFFEEH